MPFLHDDLFVDIPAVLWQQSETQLKDFYMTVSCDSAEDRLRVFCMDSSMDPSEHSNQPERTRHLSPNYKSSTDL